MKCDCRLCIEGRIVEWALQYGSRPLLLKIINRMQKEIYNIGQDLNWHQAILDGSWPSSGRILISSLQNWERGKRL